MIDPTPKQRLTTKQKLFVEAYLVNANGTEAASLAGYKGNRVTLGVVASENLRKPYIEAAVKARLTDIQRETGAYLPKLEKRLTTNLYRQCVDLDMGVIYFLRADNGLVKIGRTTNLEARLSTLRTHLPYELEVLRIIQSDRCKALEMEFHSRFASCRIRGEWFRLEPADIEDLRNG